jgi:hypothetical protein
MKESMRRKTSYICFINDVILKIFKSTPKIHFIYLKTLFFETKNLIASTEVAER